jgi:hypothetical protein
MISFNRFFKEGLGSPDEDLGYGGGVTGYGHIGDTEGPGSEAFALFIECGDALLTAEFAMFGEGFQGC